MSGATGRNADFHGERRHAPVTSKTATAVGWLAILIVVTAWVSLLVLFGAVVLDRLAGLFGGA